MLKPVLILDLLRWGTSNGVNTPIFRPSSFFFSSVALLRTQKPISKVEKSPVFAIGFPSATSLLIIAAFLGTAATFSIQKAYTSMKNASFEDPNPRASASPEGWGSKTPGSTPDIMPGAWGLQIPALHGKTCLGLVTRDDGSVEDVSQGLAKTLKSGDCYAVSIYLSHSQNYVGFNQPCRLRVWGGNSMSSKQQLLASSPLINHANWKSYTFKFTPSSDITFITFEAYYGPGATFKYKGNILLDHCSDIDQCVKA